MQLGGEADSVLSIHAVCAILHDHCHVLCMRAPVLSHTAYQWRACQAPVALAHSQPWAAGGGATSQVVSATIC